MWNSGDIDAADFGVPCEGCEMVGRQVVGPKDDAFESEKGTSLNFKVSPDFKKQFKGFAVAQDISMTDLLKEGFALSKKKRLK